MANCSFEPGPWSLALLRCFGQDMPTATLEEIAQTATRLLAQRSPKGPSPTQYQLCGPDLVSARECPSPRTLHRACEATTEATWPSAPNIVPNLPTQVAGPVRYGTPPPRAVNRVSACSAAARQHAQSEIPKAKYKAPPSSAPVTAPPKGGWVQWAHSPSRSERDKLTDYSERQIAAYQLEDLDAPSGSFTLHSIDESIRANNQIALRNVWLIGAHPSAREDARVERDLQALSSLFLDVEMMMARR